MIYTDNVLHCHVHTIRSKILSYGSCVTRDLTIVLCLTVISDQRLRPLREYETPHLHLFILLVVNVAMDSTYDAKSTVVKILVVRQPFAWSLTS